MIAFNVTYEVITPESAEHGEAEERGFKAEGVSLREALRAAGQSTGYESSDSRPQAGTWYTSAPETDYRTGAETSYAVHAPRTITAASARRLYRLLTGRGA